MKSKRSSAAAAADLYVSPLFVARRRFVEASCDRWYVLSALSGLIRPEDVIEPYDVTLNTASVGERKAWSRRVIADLVTELGSLSGMTFEIHAGASYTRFGLADGLRQLGAYVEVPLDGLSLGRQLAFYADARGRHPTRRGCSPGAARAPT